MPNSHQNLAPIVPSLRRSIATGAIGFSLVSFIVFATVAFAQTWMYQTLGVFGSFLTWAVLFVLLSGVVFGPLVVIRWRLPRFYLLFGLAFLAYSAGWMVAYFSLGRTFGELVGSLAGTVLMAIVFALGFGSLRSTVKLSALLFVSNALGYFLGYALYSSVGRPMGMLLWGVVYGLFFGAGIGAALQLVQRQRQMHVGTA